MKDALVVLNPRKVTVCEESLADLAVDKVCLRGFTEREIADEAFPRVLDMGYDWLWVVSDDVIFRPPHLRALRQLREEGHPVVTGYSQRSHTEWTVNLTDGPLLDNTPSVAAYSFREFRDVVSWPDLVVPTWFAGMSATGMSGENWKRYPFDCFGDEHEPGYSSDFKLSFRLQAEGVPIVAARDAFLYHWRHNWVNTSDPRDDSPVFGARQIVVVPGALRRWNGTEREVLSL